LPDVSRSYVVTGGGQGIGLAIAERLLADDGAVVVLDRDDAALGWTSAHPVGGRIIALAGDGADEAVTGRAADMAQDGPRISILRAPHRPRDQRSGSPSISAALRVAQARGSHHRARPGAVRTVLRGDH
jgi:NAD(P)-dependent dehydrogenase (short-subunit alcohol dehydrogenase family)